MWAVTCHPFKDSRLVVTCHWFADLEFLETKTMTYEYYKDAKGEWRWRLVASNGHIIADSGEGYESESECKRDIERVKDSADADVVKK